MGFTAKTSK